MAFDPKPTKYPFPVYTDKHYLVVKKNRGLVFDENYPYIDNSKSFKFKRFWVRLLLRIIVFPFCRPKMGLKIEGRKILKQNKELLAKGAISVSNHIHLWDYIAVMKAIRPRKLYVLVWAPNINGESGPLVRLVGGIPIPENDIKASLVYTKTIQNMLNSGGWLHLYPEGSMWEYYQPIRPFKRGAAHMAIQNNKPIIPMAFSYRKPSWLRKHILRQSAAITLRIGQPLFANTSLDVLEQEADLTRRCHEAVCSLAGINPNDNLYPSLFNKSKRIDYYTNEYGLKK